MRRSLLINIISNINNGSGLQKDYELLSKELIDLGCKVRGIDYLASAIDAKPADLNIWLEVGQPKYLSKLAPKNWLIPNPEWWRPQWDPLLFDLVLCKTRDSARLFSKLNASCMIVGFLSKDRRVDAKKEKKFIHVAGKSPFKNTKSVVEAWAKYKIPHELTIVSTLPIPSLKNITIMRRVSEDVLNNLYSSHLFHICSSAYEGWGHYAHEALSAGGIVLTTDAPPMNEFEFPGSILFKSIGSRKHLLADLSLVSSAAILEGVNKAAALSDDDIERYSKGSRHQYELEVGLFREYMVKALASV